MLKTIRSYPLLLEYLIDRNFAPAKWLSIVYYSYVHNYTAFIPLSYLKNHQVPDASKSRWWLNPFYSLYHALKKEWVDTVGPYKSSYFLKRDILHFVSGLYNIFAGIFGWVTALILFPINLARYAIYSGSYSIFFSHLTLHCRRTAYWLTHGLASCIYGIAQISTAPIVWLIRVPMRLFFSKRAEKIYIEQNLNIRKLLKVGKTTQLENNIEKTASICQNLHINFLKAFYKGQKSDIPIQSELQLYAALNYPDSCKIADDYSVRADWQNDVKMYFRLFSKAKRKLDEALLKKPIISCYWPAYYKKSIVEDAAEDAAEQIGRNCSQKALSNLFSYAQENINRIMFQVKINNAGSLFNRLIIFYPYVLLTALDKHKKVELDPQLIADNLNGQIRITNKSHIKTPVLYWLTTSKHRIQLLLFLISHYPSLVKYLTNTALDHKPYDHQNKTHLFSARDLLAQSKEGILEKLYEINPTLTSNPSPLGIKPSVHI